MCVMSYFGASDARPGGSFASSLLVVLQFLVAEGTHGCCTKVPLDARRVLQWQFIEEICFHTPLQLHEIVHERTKILFALVWCMEDSQLGINGWNA